MRLPFRPARRSRQTDPAPRPKLILHAGSQKTGTTAIQYVLSEHRDRLRAQGIWYQAIADYFPMDRKLSRARAHFAFANAVADDTPKDRKRLARLLADAETSGASRVILSAESLYRLSAKSEAGAKEKRNAKRMRFLARLAEVTAGFDTEVLLYLRRVDSFAASLYAETIVRTDRTWSFDEFLTSKDQRLGYRDKIDEFGAHFPVTVRSFETAAASGLLRSFCADAGIPDQLPEAETHRRASMSNAGLLWLRRAKVAQGNMAAPERDRRWHFSLRPENADLFAPGTPTSLWPDRATRDAFIARHQAGVTEIAFPAPPAEIAPPALWDDSQHQEAERRFAAWQSANAALIRRRERKRVPPYVLEP